MGKTNIRKRIWRLLETEGVALFPGAWGRIPNFVGAERAARMASTLDVFKKANLIKTNPDSPQKALREIALREGKVIFMAVPRLRASQCFIKIDPKRIRSSFSFAATIKGAFQLGEQVHPREIPTIDLILAGSVAVNRKGQRIGKGGGYSDLEYALGRTFGFVKEDTPILTTVHPLQILEEDFPWAPHDIPVDFIVTPLRVIETRAAIPRPPGLIWDLIDEARIRSVPILQELREDE